MPEERQKRDLRLTPASDTELDALSEISAADISRAATAWEAVAPPEMRPVLDAEVEA